MTRADFAIAVSLFALVVAGVSLWLSWRRDRRDVDAIEPVIDVRCHEDPEYPGFYVVTLSIENRGPLLLRLTTVSLRSDTTVNFVRPVNRGDSWDPHWDFEAGERYREITPNAKLFPPTSELGRNRWSLAPYLDASTLLRPADVFIEFKYSSLSRRRLSVRRSIKMAIP